MSLRVVSGRRSDCNLFLDGGYVYTTDTVKNGCRYLKCTDSDCTGTAVIRPGATCVVSNRPHCHLPDRAQLESALFRDGIRQKATECGSSASLRRIYDVESARYPKGSILTGFPQDEQIMRRSRKRSVPPVPQDLDDLQDILKFQPQWHNYGLACNSEQSLFRETLLVDDEHDSRVSVLVSPYFADLLCVPGVELALDSTFDVRPSRPETEQFMTLHAFEVVDGMRHAYPCAYALMERRNEPSYCAALTGINSAVGGGMNPFSLMADYEKAVHNAGIVQWPDLQTSGCWFHFCNATYKQARCLGVADLCLEDDLADKSLRKCMALPLLPPLDIPEGLALVEEEVELHGHKNAFRPFVTYLREFWLDDGKVGPEMLSVFERDVRTNNAVESSHYAFFRKVELRRPSYWRFNEALKSYDFACYQDRQRTWGMVPVRRKRRKVYVDQDESIKAMQSDLTAGHISLDEFLNRACHAVEGLQGRLRDHHATLSARRDHM